MRRANLTVPEKLKMQREGYKFFCEHHKTANCAIGENIGLTCVHAPNHKTREGCRYWKPVHIERRDELICLRAENERLREALKDALVWLGDLHGGRPVMSVDSMRNIANSSAALDGVTEPASSWRDIESAPRDKEILVFGKKDDGTDYQDVCKYFDAANCWPIVLMHGYLAPTHWMPLPEPPR